MNYLTLLMSMAYKYMIPLHSWHIKGEKTGLPEQPKTVHGYEYKHNQNKEPAGPSSAILSQRMTQLISMVQNRDWQQYIYDLITHN